MCEHSGVRFPLYVPRGYRTTRTRKPTPVPPLREPTAYYATLSGFVTRYDKSVLFDERARPPPSSGKFIIMFRTHVRTYRAATIPPYSEAGRCVSLYRSAGERRGQNGEDTPPPCRSAKLTSSFPFASAETRVSLRLAQTRPFTERRYPSRMISVRGGDETNL